MDAAYLDEDERELELTRHVSLRELDPIALNELRHHGSCQVRIPESWYDIDSPGHYKRRIKSISLSIPSVTGPFVPVRCTLTLMKSEMRTSDQAGAQYSRTTGDTRFIDDLTPTQSIVTSRATEDSGLFETNLRDERYLPFEGAGAISEWHLQLPDTWRQFDYQSISDVIIHVRYTALDGGQTLRNAATGSLTDRLNALQDADNNAFGLVHMISAKQDESDAWETFINPAEEVTSPSLGIHIAKPQLPAFLAHRDVTVVTIHAWLFAKNTITTTNTQLQLKLGSDTMAFSATNPPAQVAQASLTPTPAPALEPWTFTLDDQTPGDMVLQLPSGDQRIDETQVEDIVFLIQYNLTTT